jgi:hypothetical protein
MFILRPPYYHSGQTRLSSPLPFLVESCFGSLLGRISSASALRLGWRAEFKYRDKPRKTESARVEGGTSYLNRPARSRLWYGARANDRIAGCFSSSLLEVASQQTQNMTAPADTLTSSPVIMAASSEHKKATTAAICFGSISVLRGVDSSLSATT